jgi:hypothetical protein
MFKHIVRVVTFLLFICWVVFLWRAYGHTQIEKWIILGSAIISLTIWQLMISYDNNKKMIWLAMSTIFVPMVIRLLYTLLFVSCAEAPECRYANVLFLSMQSGLLIYIGNKFHEVFS